jgi:titin
VNSYRVEVSLDGLNWTLVAKKPSTSHIISRLKPGTDYQVRVAAVTRSGTSAYSYSRFTTLATLPSAATGLTASNVTGSGFTVGWNNPVTNGGSAITDYTVEVNGGGYNWTSQSASNGTTMNLIGMKPGTKYSVRVKALNGVGFSKASKTMVVTTPAQLPSAVNPTLRSSTATSASLAWAAPANGGSKITDYLAEYSTDGGETWKTVPKNVSSSTNLTLKGLKPATTYLVRISAKNILGYGSPSASIEVRTN